MPGRAAIPWNASEKITVPTIAAALFRVTVELGRRGIAIRQLAQEQRSLEELFFQLTEEVS